MVLGALLALASALPGYATAVIDATTSFSSPLTSYFYTVNAAGPEDIFEFTLFLQGPALTGTITTPTGWLVSASDTFIDWVANDPSQNIVAGTALSGFSFSSLQTPDSATFVTIGFDAFGIPTISSDSTLGPAASAAIPEPGTSVLVPIGLVVGLITTRVAKSMMGR
jgi:hypothetical protein